MHHESLFIFLKLTLLSPEHARAIATLQVLLTMVKLDEESQNSVHEKPNTSPTTSDAKHTMVIISHYI